MGLKKLFTAIGGQAPSNGAEIAINMSMPYCVKAKICGIVDFLYHKWNCEEVEAKSKAAKGSKIKMTDNLESYVYRCTDGDLAIPGEYLRQSMVHAAKFKQDPRSKRKTAADLYKGGLLVVPEHASVGKEKWDYEDRRRVVVQRSGITRTRPALKAGWEATFEIMVNVPEYIRESDLHEILSLAGRLIGIGDFRPSYGRFQIVHFERMT